MIHFLMLFQFIQLKQIMIQRTQLADKTNQSENETESRKFDSECGCKSHPGEKGSYFLVDQPWFKFCKECAFNMALYGKKIDKDLTPQQFQHKNKLGSLSDFMKTTLQKVDRGNKQLSTLTSKIEGTLNSQISRTVQMFNEYVQKICQIRDEVMEIYENSFPRSAQDYFQRQTKVLLAQIEVKKDLKFLESNYKNLIEGSPQFMQSNIKIWKENLQTLEKLLPKQNEEDELNDFIRQRNQHIVSKLNQVSLFSFFPMKTCLNIQQNQISQTVKQSSNLNSCSSKQNKAPTKLKLRSRVQNSNIAQNGRISHKNKSIEEKISRSRQRLINGSNKSQLSFGNPVLMDFNQ